MEEFGLTVSNGPTSVPFPLLTHEGVLAYRRAIIQPEVLASCAFKYDSTLILRNLAKHSKFIKDLWSHPETTRIVSKMAGIPLSVVMPIEIGHTNIQTSSSTIEEMMLGLRRVEIIGEASYDPSTVDSVAPWQ
jgi:hypothetical protein